jgi:alkanesulfonate monooxygenase SsuD/methylene tetrahydromethanopterin reductase-like flavin-dependent oxidoreductase (luciferase family)
MLEGDRRCLKEIQVADVFTDGTVDRWSGPVLGQKNKLKLAVFGSNASHGSSITDAEGHIEGDWDEQVRVARAAEDAGFDAIIPVARWKGHGGATNFNHRSFDTLVWAAGLAAVTSRIQVFSTTHVPTIHPVRAAKQLASIDHISGGRLGLNVVAGWNAAEFGMFGLGQREHDERYDEADEWVDLMRKLWSEPEPFDFDGKFYSSKGAYSSPRPVQREQPVIMSAGLSPRGKRFAFQNADMIFVQAPDLSKLAGDIAEIRAEAAGFDSQLRVCLPTHVVVGDTDQDAQAYWDYYVHERGDVQGAENYLGSLIAGDMRTRSPEQWRSFTTGMIAGGGSVPLIGSPERVVEQLQDLSDAGVDGVTMSWVDYERSLNDFKARVMPLLVEAGLREDA